MPRFLFCLHPELHFLYLNVSCKMRNKDLNFRIPEKAMFSYSGYFRPIHSAFSDWKCPLVRSALCDKTVFRFSRALRQSKDMFLRAMWPWARHSTRAMIRCALVKLPLKA